MNNHNNTNNYNNLYQSSFEVGDISQYRPQNNTNNMSIAGKSTGVKNPNQSSRGSLHDAVEREAMMSKRNSQETYRRQLQQDRTAQPIENTRAPLRKQQQQQHQHQHSSDLYEDNATNMDPNLTKMTNTDPVAMSNRKRFQQQQYAQDLKLDELRAKEQSNLTSEQFNLRPPLPRRTQEVENTSLIIGNKDQGNDSISQNQRSSRFGRLNNQIYNNDRENAGTYYDNSIRRTHSEDTENEPSNNISSPRRGSILRYTRYLYSIL